jgi:DNA repair protein RadC
MTSSDERTVARAIKILSRELAAPGELLTAPSVVKRYLTLRLAKKEHEIFGALWLNAKNQLIANEDMFFGTLTQATIHPREVVKKALGYNAASLVCYHNHPSGTPSPSEADRQITTVLKNALQLVEVRLIDHIIVGGLDCYSFAEHGDL